MSRLSGEFATRAQRQGRLDEEDTQDLEPLRWEGASRPVRQAQESRELAAMYE